MNLPSLSPLPACIFWNFLTLDMVEAEEVQLHIMTAQEDQEASSPAYSNFNKSTSPQIVNYIWGLRMVIYMLFVLFGQAAATLFGRLLRMATFAQLTGYVSDIFLQRRGCARPLFIAITQAALSVGLIVIASGFPYNLYVGTILVGVCYGSQWSLLASVASEIFGVGHLGTIVNAFAVASPIGSYIFSVRIIGYIYDKAASGEDNSCYGTHCFMLSFLIIAFFALCGSLVALLLFFRTKRFYDQVVLRKLQQCYRT